MNVPPELLRIRRLRHNKTGGEPLLDIEDFVIPVASCLLLSGRNGAGKTTLLKIIAGLESPDDGWVQLGDNTLPWSKARQRYRRDVIYLHQQPYLFDCSVAENVGYGLRSAGMGRAEIARRVAQALETAALAHLAGRNARELSGGEKQRVALTRALVLAPRLLLLDEPLASLDADARERTLAFVQELKRSGIAVVLTSHERLSVAVADHHYELDGGRLTLLRRPEGAAAGVVAIDGGNVLPYRPSHGRSRDGKTS
ncbi:MAG: energy-coupling factor ABC transporter ATP-binding protein [Sulfurifustis sp.]